MSLSVVSSMHWTVFVQKEAPRSSNMYIGNCFGQHGVTIGMFFSAC